MDTLFISKPLSLYFQEINQDFLPNKKLLFRFRKQRKGRSPFSLRFEGAFKTSNSENKSLLLSKDFRFKQTLIFNNYFGISTNYIPYQSNGLEVTLKKRFYPLKLNTTVQTFNNLSKNIHLQRVSLGYSQPPHKIKFNYEKTQPPYYELEVSYIMSPKIKTITDLDLGVSFTLNQKNSYDIKNYEFFARALLKKYEFIAALTSNKIAKGSKKPTPENIVFAFKNKSQSNLFNFILEHNLQDKKSLLTAIYESNLEDAITLKNLVNSEYQVSAAIVYKLNDFCKIIHSSSINIKRFFNQGEKYKLGFGVVLEL